MTWLWTLAAVACAAAPGGMTPYDALPAYSRDFVDAELAPVSAPAAPMATIGRNTSTRDTGYRALGLLYRGGLGDQDRAVPMLEWLMGMQCTDAGSRDFGLWWRNEATKLADQNWREFVGCTLILIRARFPDALPEALARAVDASLVRAAEGARRRNVGADYSNIAIMSAFLMAYVGAAQDREDLAAAGSAKAREVYDLFRQEGTFSEYNSITYYGVNLKALALWRALGPSGTMRRMGAELEAALWRDMAAFYHAGLKNMAAPYFRAYGMDMTRHNTPTGVYIALALNDSALAPLPREGGAKQFERVYALPALAAGLCVPPDALERFRGFDGPRRLERRVPNRRPGWPVKKVTATLETDWMMGGAAGHRRVWEQIHPGALHWRVPGAAHVGWVLVPGAQQRDVTASDGVFRVLQGYKKRRPLVLYVHAEGAEAADFGADAWDLPGLRIEVDTRLSPPSVKRVTSGRAKHEQGIESSAEPVYEIRYEAPAADSSEDAVLLTLTPG